MTATCQRVGPAETRRLIDYYTLHRFGYVLSPSEFARQAGVDVSRIDDLLAQKPVPDDDLNRIARTIDVGARLLSEISGRREMAAATYASLGQFFGAVNQQPKQRRAA